MVLNSLVAASIKVVSVKVLKRYHDEGAKECQLSANTDKGRVDVAKTVFFA